MLSTKAQRVFRHIVQYAQEKGYPPTLREIGEEFAIQSTNGVRYFLDVLKRDGYIHRNKKISRGIEIPEKSLQRFIHLYGDENLRGEVFGGNGIPILGRVAAGSPLLAAANVEGHLTIEESFAGSGNRFALRIKGDSMIDAGIQEDDVVVVHQIDHADDGAIVVALVDDDATVKTFRRFRDRVELRPANKNYRPIVIRDAHQLRILGVVMGLVRRSLGSSKYSGSFPIRRLAGR